MALFDDGPADSGVFSFTVDETAKGYLLETARWAKFLSIVGFVLMGLLIIVGAVATVFMSNLDSSLGASLPGGVMLVIYLAIGALYFFPTYYLFKFSTLIKPALLSSNTQDFNDALSYLRRAFRFIGIVTLVILGIYALMFIVGIISVAMR